MTTGINISEKKKKALKNIAWAICGKIFSLISVLVVGIIVARYLGKEQYGIMNYVISIVAIFQVFADFGLDLIQIREESKNPEMRDKIIGTVFFLKLFFAALTLLAIFITVCLFIHDDYIQAYIMLSMVWNEYVVKTEISRNIIGMIIKVGLVLFHLSLFWFICSLLFDSLLLAIGYVISYVKKIDTVKKWTFDKSLAIYMMKQAFPLLLSGAAIIVYNRIDQVMIGDMIDKSHLGVYSVAIRFTELLVFVPTIIAQTISPMLVEKRKEDLNRYEECSRIFINVTVSLCIMMAVATSLLSYPIVYITFGQAYIGAASVLSILAFKVIGDALSQTSGQLMIVEGIQQYAPIRNLIGCATCIILNLILIKHYGIHGAAYTALITIFVSGTFSNFLIPAYNGIFYKQLRAIFVGWRDIMNIKTILQ